MKTECLAADCAALTKAASLLKAGEVVAFPTETVYGLGADALNPAAVAKIFAAKERPADNPLIAHIHDLDMLSLLARQVDDRAKALMDAFWPGPLTLIFPRTQAVPDIVSAGLDTVAVRMPSHPVALKLIGETGRPIAAPSANRSGRPSPSTAAHVLEDMEGRIPLILDGGASGFGVESTVLDLTGEVPVVLRPGGVTLEMVRQVLPEARVDAAVLKPLAQDAQARSPGMKHRHYAPQAQVLIIKGEPDRVQSKTCALYDEAIAAGKVPAIMCSQQMCPRYGARKTQGIGATPEEMASNLFAALRDLDAQGVELILAEAVEAEGMGLALMNRLLRAADFSVVEG